MKGIGIVELIKRYIDKNIPLMVKDTCNGPLLPTIYTFFILLWFSISNASSVISVLRSISTGVNNIRATSKATLPRPTMTAVSWEFKHIFSLRYDASGRPL